MAADIIIRLTDEQEDLLRNWNTVPIIPGFERRLAVLYNDFRNQAIAALATYDQLVAEAKAASDE